MLQDFRNAQYVQMNRHEDYLRTIRGARRVNRCKAYIVPFDALNFDGIACEETYEMIHAAECDWYVLFSYGCPVAVIDKYLGWYPMEHHNYSHTTWQHIRKACEMLQADYYNRDGHIWMPFDSEFFYIGHVSSYTF